MGLVILNFCGVLMSLKSIFSGVSGMRSLSNRRRFRGVERRVTPSFSGELSLVGVRMVEWNEEFRLSSMSGDHVTGSRFRPGSEKNIFESSGDTHRYYIFREVVE